VQREKKLWGERWLLRIDSTHATSYLILKAMTRCSWHVHAAKYNLFVVLSGKVGIKTEDGETILGPGEEFTIAPGVFHEFRVYENSEMIEEMYVAYEESDITRKDIGGSLDE
jgi:mannose-6-phosphate isomerase-like protein (cupin superfamily)